jgi:hypothetical protein
LASAGNALQKKIISSAASPILTVPGDAILDFRALSTLPVPRDNHIHDIDYSVLQRADCPDTGI